MDGMLSQDEINALLNGVDLSADDKGSAAATTATVDSSEEGLTDWGSSQYQYGDFCNYTVFFSKP